MKVALIYPSVTVAVSTVREHQCDIAHVHSVAQFLPAVRGSYPDVRLVLASAIAHLLACLVLLPGCAKMESSTPEPARTTDKPRTNRALKPGDSDYPLVNPSASQIVEVTVVAPPSIPVELHLHYAVDAQPDASNPQGWVTRAGCKWTEDPMLHVELLLPLKKSGDTYSGSFSRDYFQAGPCGWQLNAVTSPIVMSPIAFFTHFPKNAHHRPTQSVNDFWCTRKGKDQPPQPQAEPEDIHCTFAMGAWSLRANKWSSIPIPANERHWDRIITQYTKSMRIEFHDLGELIPASVQHDH